MTARRQKDSTEEISVAGKNIGGQLHRLIRKYGVLNTRTAITEVRNVMPVDARDAKGAKIEFEETALEEMYRNYVASSKHPVLTFIEYKSLVDIVIDVMCLVQGMQGDEQ